MKTNVHLNSLAAYAEGVEGGFSEREQLILGALRKLGQATDRELTAALGFTECNATRPRISEMCKRGYLEEIGSKLDQLTRRMVRIVRVRRPIPDETQIEMILERAMS